MTQVPEKIHFTLAHLLVTEFFLCGLKYFSVIYHSQDKTDVTNINKKSASPPNQSDLSSPLSCGSVGGLGVDITYSICVSLGVPCDIWYLPQQFGSHSAHAYGLPLGGTGILLPLQARYSQFVSEVGASASLVRLLHQCSMYHTATQGADFCALGVCQGSFVYSGFRPTY